MIQIYKALHKISAWQMRIIALAFFVVLVGGGSQFLANAFAAGVGPELPIQVTPVVTQVPMSTTYPKQHVIIKHAGISTPGGYTVIPNR